MGQLNRAKGCPDIWLNMILPWRLFVDEMNMESVD